MPVFDGHVRAWQTTYLPQTALGITFAKDMPEANETRGRHGDCSSSSRSDRRQLMGGVEVAYSVRYALQACGWQARKKCILRGRTILAIFRTSTKELSVNSADREPLNKVPCPNCGQTVDDRAVGCPHCGEQIYVEHPGDITPTKHSQIQYPDEADATGRSRRLDRKR
jgi:predicted RNA-binding Zn-ribbon protein involved in translation (DUF1610 family)